MEALNPIQLWIVHRWMCQANFQLGGKGGEDLACELYTIVTVDLQEHPKVAMYLCIIVPATVVVRLSGIG